MLVRISDLAKGRRHFDFHLTGDEVYTAVGRRSDIGSGIAGRVSVDAEMVDRTVTLSGQVILNLAGVCSRCAEDFEAEARIPWKLILMPRSERPGPQIDDMEAGYYSGERINLAQHALDGVGLLFPEILLCAPDCRGICPGCGLNLNVEKCRCP